MSGPRGRSLPLLGIGCALALLGACGEVATAPSAADAEQAHSVGTVTGTVVAPDGTTAMEGAVVRLAGGGDHSAEAVTDAHGRYALEGVPAGRRTFEARHGIFLAEFEVDVSASRAVEAPPAVLAGRAPLAYVPGQFDAVERVLEDDLGIAVEAIAASDLALPEVTARYPMIFINCGVEGAEGYERDPAVIENLRAYIAAGGLLYVSDLEVELVHYLFPDDVLALGEGVRGRSANEGGEEVSADMLKARVASPALRDFLGGRTTMDVAFDLDTWLSVTEISDRPEVLVRADYEDLFTGPVRGGPLALAIEHGRGHLVYTSFHNAAEASAEQLAVLRHFVFAFGG